MKKKKKTTPGILQILNFQQLESPLKYPHQTLEKVKAQQHFFICKKKNKLWNRKVPSEITIYFNIGQNYYRLF